MAILPIILICSFTLWTILEDRKGAGVMQTVFMLSFLGWVATVLLNKGMSTGFPTLAISFLALSIYGFLIQKVFKYTSMRILLGALAISPFIYWQSNPLELSIDKNLITSELQIDKAYELIVKCKHSKVADVEKQLKTLPLVEGISSWNVMDAEATELDDYLLVNIKNGKCDYPLITKIEGINGVKWIEQNETWSIEEQTAKEDIATSTTANSVNDPRARNQWSFNNLSMDQYHNILQNSGIKPIKPVKLFMVDSGVNFQHEDLKGAVISHKSANQQRNETDANGHGTHCAGIAAAVTNNKLGIASFNPGNDFVSVGSVGVLNRFGLATQSAIISGLIEAADAGADVINMSFGGRSQQLKEEAYNDAFAYLKRKNIILVAAAGNSAADASQYLPTGRDDVISVSATDRSNGKAQFSNYVQNTGMGIAAPGTSILSTYKSSYASLDGTSMAAPHVTGLLAILRAIRPDLTTEEAFKILNSTGTTTKDGKATGKLINPAEALKAVMD